MKSKVAAIARRTKIEKINGQTGPFPLVGIGASAGGLEAISILLEHLPPDLGMAYVVIQHLDPNHNSILQELLEKKTKMKVEKVRNNMRIIPDHVYVIPPNTFIAVTDDVLHLVPRVKLDGVFHPIDHFFSGLAATYAHHAIGIILSGTASDGTAGLKAIKAEGGITYAQNETAKYQGMPQSASNAGYVDFILSPENIAKDLITLSKYPRKIISSNEMLSKNENEIRKIIIILNNSRKVDFSSYKKNTVHRRIIRRMILNRMDKLEDYTTFLGENDHEVELLYKDLLINVTSFFREPSVYHSLTKNIFPSIIKYKKQNEPIRIWVAGCAMGEEACSVAIALVEFLGDNTMNIPIQIFATDLNATSIEKARQGIYSKDVLENVSPERLKRFFVKIDGSYQVIKSIRDTCVFAPHNLLKDPPFSRIDLISCQNVLIYLEAIPQKKILQTFHYALKPSGYLLLGKSETIGNADALFLQPDKNIKIYTRKQTTTTLRFDLRNHNTHLESAEAQDKLPPGNGIGTDIEKETDKLLLSRYVPAAVVVNNDMEIIRFRGSTSHYLEPAGGKASFHLFKMIKDELVFELRALINKAKKEGSSVKKENLIVALDSNIRELTIEVIPMRTSVKEQYYLIVFRENSGYSSLLTDSPPQAPGKKPDVKTRQIIDLEQKLKDAWEHITSMNEKFEATQEELQSANEEVLSSNEELQSINEELETSKEELQSTNEELITINEELQHRNTEIKRAMDYTEAIVETMIEPLIVLNEQLRVRTANKAFYQTFRLTAGETEGNLFYEVGNRLWDIPEMREKLNEIISTKKSFSELEIRKNFPGIGLKIMLLNAAQLIQEDKKVRILLAIQDITIPKLAEELIKESEVRFRRMADNAPMMIWISDQNNSRTYFNMAWLDYTGKSFEEETGKGWQKSIHPDDLERYLSVYSGSFDPKQKFNIEYRLKRTDGIYHWIMESGGCMYASDGAITGFIGSCMDINEKIELEHRKDEFISIASHELKTPVTSVKAYAQILQQDLKEAGDLKSGKILKKMDAQLDRLNNLIRDLLDVTKIVQGNLNFKKTSFDINELIKATIEEMQSTLHNHIIVERLKSLKKVWGDKDRIGQVINNLLSNAVKYSPSANEVVISTRTEGDVVMISVKDFGIGLTKETKIKVFERFFRIEAKENTFPGLGLGLYIASEIIKHHNGHIGVKSELGKGSTFWFSLPVKKA